MSATAVAAPVRRKPPAAVRRQRFLVAVANHSLLIAAAALFLAPVVFITLTALMTTKQALSPRVWPEPFAWGNFIDVFETAPLWKWAFNSFLYASLGTLGLLVVHRASSSSASASIIARRARCIRLLIVPTRTPSTSAASW